MKKNTYSLLSSEWMLTDECRNSLVPFIFELITGNTSDNSFPETSVVYTNSSLTEYSSNLNDVKSSNGSVAIIKMHHPIFKYDQTCGPKGTQTVMQIMDDLARNNDVSGVLLHVASGGGQGSGNSEFAEYNFNYPKPLGVFSKDTIASAAYYFSAGADFIMVSKHADYIGSIGTMHQKLDVTGILEKRGAKLYEIYAALSTEKNIESRSLKEGDDKPLLTNILNPKQSEFQSDMIKYRPQLNPVVFKGGIFPPSTALENGLIDYIGSESDSIQKIYELAEKNNNKNPKTKNMSQEIKVPHIQNALNMGDTPFQSNENGVFLQESQLQTLNSSIEKMAGELSTEKQNLTAANGKITAAETTINATLDNAEIDYSKEDSLTTRINLLNAQRNEYAKNSGAKPTQAASTGDPSLETQHDDVFNSYEHNKEAMKIINS